MNDIKNKIEELREDCIREANIEADEMNKNIDEKIENDIKEQLDEYSKKQRIRYDREMKGFKKQYNIKKYELEKNSKMNLLEKQKEIIIDLINSVEKKMKDFVHSEKYFDYLVKNINNSLNKIGSKTNSVIIYITDYDYNRYSNMLSASFKDYTIKTISDENIGGCKCLDKDSNIIIDNTISLLIRERINQIY